MLRKLIQPIRYFYYHHNHTLRWMIVTAVLGVLLALTMTFMDWNQYIWSWCGSMFKASSGGLLGWFISRFVTGLDLSEIPLDKRPNAALSQAILIGGFAIAVALSA